ncbi:MAG: class I SAM-dependent methyltransferase [bacterium]|nr:class I SAM-dependent methyltransferase [bacterium]
MHSDSIEAYDLPERVRAYDADMDVMHPLRWKMIEIALEVLPFQQGRALRALDLGVGTGVFSKRLLEKYPNSTVVAIDGAASMLQLAEARLGKLAQRVEWVQADFRSIPDAFTEPGTFDVAISSYALHHLDTREKLAALKTVVQAMKPGGWFMNADIVIAAASDVEQRIQEMRVQAVTDRAPADDERFCSARATRQFLDDLEEAEHDRPQTLAEDMRVLRESGIASAEVFWREYREVVIGGPVA